MNVLTITSLFPNSAQPDFGNFIFQRMAAFSRIRGNKLTAIAPVPYFPQFITIDRYAAFQRIPKHEKRDGIDVFHPRYPLIPKIAMPFHGLLMTLGIIKTAKRLHRQHRFDLVDGHYIYPDGLAGVLIAKSLKLPVALSARGSDIHQFAKFPAILPQIAYALNQSDYIISVCNGLKQDMVAIGVNEREIQVIPNGIDVSRFTTKDRTSVRQLLGIPPEARLVLTVGSLVPVKSHQSIIRALPEVLAKHPTTQLCIIGDGPERGNLLSTAEQVGVVDRVRLVGHIPNADLSDWYNAADVFCLASSREGWANVIMEAMACGTPVVATNVYGAPEIITKPEVGILVERSPQAIAKALKTALERSWDRQVIREHVAGRSWEVVAREVADVFEKAIRGWEEKRL